MDAQRFWDIIRKACRPGEEDDWYAALVARLAQLPPEEILAFDRQFHERTNAAYTVDLWGAAYLINGGASDDGFFYFRCWLVGMGKRVCEQALANPDSLADVVDPDREYEAEIYSVGVAAWEERTGRSTDEYTAEWDRLGPSPRGELKGERWDFDDDEQIWRRLPRLARLYLEGPGPDGKLGGQTH